MRVSGSGRRLCHISTTSHGFNNERVPRKTFLTLVWKVGFVKKKYNCVRSCAFSCIEIPLVNTNDTDSRFFLEVFRLDFLKMKRSLSELLGERPLLEEGLLLDKAEVNRHLLKLIRQVASGPQFYKLMFTGFKS